MSRDKTGGPFAAIIFGDFIRAEFVQPAPAFEQGSGAKSAVMLGSGLERLIAVDLPLVFQTARVVGERLGHGVVLFLLDEIPELQLRGGEIIGFQLATN